MVCGICYDVVRGIGRCKEECFVVNQADDTNIYGKRSDG